MKKVLLIITLFLNIKICLGSDKPHASSSNIKNFSMEQTQAVIKYKKALEFVGKKDFVKAIETLQTIKFYENKYIEQFKNNMSTLFLSLGNELSKKSFLKAESAFIAAIIWNSNNFEAQKALKEIREKIKEMGKTSKTLAMNLFDSGF